ncbi:hypothetical protein PSJ72_14935 [Escherichia coli]|nr:hypothetical protein [Escherichia coli]
MHSVNFYSFRVLTHKGSRTSKRLNNLGLSDKKKQHMNYLLSILIAIKNTPIEFGLSKTKVSLEQHTSLTFDAQNQVIYGYVKVGKYGESSEIKDDKLTKIRYTTTINDVTLKQRYILIFFARQFRRRDYSISR